MKLNKKWIYALGAFASTTLVLAPSSIIITSCSNSTVDDKIDYNKQAEDAIFNGDRMGKSASTFLCDFNITNKTCVIKKIGLNYFTNEIPKINEDQTENTIRIPSQFIYNNEIYTVSSMDIYYGPKAHQEEYLQMIEFDTNLNIVKSDAKFIISNVNSDLSSLLKVINCPNVEFIISSSVPKLDVFTFNSKNSPKISPVIPYAPLTTFVMPDSVEIINDYSFYYCKNLTNINIPSSVTSIGKLAFYQCSNLSNIKIPESIINIGESAFYGTKDLTWQIIPKKIYQNEISGGYFSGLDMTGFEIPSTVKTIGNHAFTKVNLTSINIPSDVVSIGDYAFSGCENLTNITLPNGLTSIGKFAFERCHNLKEIYIPDTVTSIASSAFYRCGSLSEIHLPTNITQILSNTFEGCVNLTSIVIPKSVTSIDIRAFSSCYKLSKVQLQEGLVKIGAFAFFDCEAMQEVVIPRSVSQFGESIFFRYENKNPSLSIKFYTQEQMDLFLENNANEKSYCSLITN